MASLDYKLRKDTLENILFPRMDTVAEIFACNKNKRFVLFKPHTLLCSVVNTFA